VYAPAQGGAAQGCAAVAGQRQTLADQCSARGGAMRWRAIGDHGAAGQQGLTLALVSAQPVPFLKNIRTLHTP
jgi:hypothetical protein